ncbi:type IV pilus biogenesis/stability protein PilW [Grimontia hollisae]|uniref:Tetratricopeptide repeat protein n=3 Tax=Grimontia hollisae TaxID=673 RepID=A0A377HPR9_GRIHO|nr:type IV pilus biogenesis/stability protein PilW [Grimontia hollisae]AMG31196.1 type IV pilus biogenesis/stability protein PilW [Grimontia hollisae]MDF2185343.1 type IV pilus biogenesis/stability protein PilW [Grimontia hollisae]STO46285.1 tetratricopeptide repeat protein [Grimontia hollisae]STO58251.1 tetratricopeptide repeat protein [Grimontia hollisae]STQ76775.1 tetratricopeptide repeat protein [Grimontia hollisae]
MARTLSALLLIGLLSGCVTVTEKQNNTKFDSIDAAESRITLGLAYLKAGQWERARQNLETAVQFAPKYYRSRISFAYYLQEVGEYDQAEEQYKTALRHSPQNGDVRNNYGVFLCRQERYDEAQRAFAKAIEQPYYYKLSGSYENAALCALKEGDRDSAKVWFAKAIDHEPNRPLSSVKLAQMEVEDNQLNEARIRLFHFHKRYGYKPATLLILTELENKAGRPSQAERYANLLANTFPESREYRQYLTNE